MISKLLANLKGKKGSALVSVFMVIMVMLVLGMGILALTMNNVKQSATVDNYERDYYAADRAVQQGAENLKRTVRDYYNDLALKFADTANVAAYNAAYSGFFANVRSNAAGSFIEPALDTSRGGPTGTVTSVTMGTPVGDTCVYTISSTASAGETTRTVSKSITIIRTEKYKTEFVTKFGNNALIAGDNVDMTGNKNAKIDVSGDVIVGGDVVETGHGGSGYFDATNYDPAHPEMYTDTTIDSKLTWTLSYASFPQTAKDEAIAAAAMPKITNNATVLASGYPTVFNIEGNNGASYTIKGASTATSGQIGCTGDLTLDGATLSGVSIYVSGDLTIKNNTSLNGVSIYVTGSSSLADISDSTLTNVKIYCDGSLTSYDTVYRHNSAGRGCQVAVRNNTTLSGDSLDSQQSKCYFYTGGTFQILSSRFDNIVVYAGTKLEIMLENHGNRKGNRSELSGLLYTSGDAVINSCLIRGQLVAKHNILADDTNGSTLADLIFAPADISDLLNDPTFTSSIFANSSLGSTTKIYIKPLVNEMYSGETGIKES